MTEAYPERRRNIVISTGAGISAESGVHTYRDLDGLWQTNDPNAVMHADGWKRNPKRLIDFQNKLRSSFADANYEPNAAHLALTRLQQEWKHGTVTVLTQNIDGLHQRAGTTGVLAVHGTGVEKFCEACYTVTPYGQDIDLATPCGMCGAVGTIRPNIVMFGEMPHHLDTIEKLLEDCTIFCAIGTSLEVSPANMFFIRAADYGADTTLINIEPLNGWSRSLEQGFDRVIYGMAGVEVPKWVDGLLAD